MASKIKPPRNVTEWPDRALDCQEALHQAFLDVVERAVEIGWTAEESIKALEALAWYERKAMLANAETDAAIARATGLIQ